MRKNIKIALGVVAAAGIATGAYFILKKPTPPPPQGGAGGGGGGGGTTGGGGGGIQPPPVPIFLGPADNGGTTKLNVGDVLIASFPESSMTGNVWTMDESGAPLKAIPLPPEVAAATGIHSFAFQAVQPGSASLKGTNTLPDTTTSTWMQTIEVTGTISTGGGGPGVFHGGGVISFQPGKFGVKTF
jgi:predicted secreted protein